MSSGSFLCNECQDKQFAEIRKIVKGEKPMAKPKLQMTVSEFIDLKHVQKLSNVEIAKLKEVSEATIYNWIGKNKKRIDEKLNSENPLNESESIDFKSKYKSLEAEVKVKTGQLYELKKEMELIEKQRKEIVGRLEEENETLRKKVIDLNESLINKEHASQSDNEWQDKFKKEKAAHEHLFNYLQAIR